jgi:hypothetical protein
MNALVYEDGTTNSFFSFGKPPSVLLTLTTACGLIICYYFTHAIHFVMLAEG